MVWTLQIEFLFRFLFWTILFQLEMLCLFCSEVDEFTQVLVLHSEMQLLLLSRSNSLGYHWDECAHMAKFKFSFDSNCFWVIALNTCVCFFVFFLWIWILLCTILELKCSWDFKASLLSDSPTGNSRLPLLLPPLLSSFYLFLTIQFESFFFFLGATSAVIDKGQVCVFVLLSMIIRCNISGFRSIVEVLAIERCSWVSTICFVQNLDWLNKLWSRCFRIWRQLYRFGCATD